MARSITASVGRMGGKNLPPDVRVVQELLNNVPVAAGGPPLLLATDSICGPLTIEAIQKFQIHHFGWSGADGRVDPDGQTLKKLNEFDKGVSLRPPALTTASSLQCPHFGTVKAVPTRMRPGPVGSAQLTSSDQFVVSGCVCTSGPGNPSPCVTVKWQGAPNQPLDATSLGMCLNAGGANQGRVIVVRA